MIEYNSEVIREFADRLYKRADSVVASYTLLGGLIGFAGGWLGGTALAGGSEDRLLFAIALAGVLGWVGYRIAQGKAFLLRLQAQTALCQVQIEGNTRPRS